MRNELAGVLAWRARLDDSPRDLFHALDLVSSEKPTETAWALFNRSLVLSQLGFVDAALASWDDFLAVEPGDSAWAKEARSRIGQLRAQVPKVDLAEKFEAFQSILESFAGKEVPPKGVDLAVSLRKLQALAEDIRSRTGDESLEDVVGRFRRAEEPSDRSDLAALVRAHALYSEGWNDYQQHRLTPAVAKLRQARDLFRSLDSPWHLWAEFYLACAAQQEENFARSSEILNQLASSTAPKPYWYLRAHIEWVRGVNHYMGGRPIEAADRFLEAEGHFEKAQSWENAAVLKVLIGESMVLVGNDVSGWRWLYRGVADSQSLGTPRRRLAFFSPLVGLAEARDEPNAALFYQRFMTEAAGEMNNPRIEYVTLLSEADSLIASGRIQAAAPILDRASALVASLDGTSLDRARAALAVSRAEWSLESGETLDQDLIHQLGQSLDTLEQLGYGTRLTNQALEVRSRIRERLGDREGAVEDLAKSWQVFQRTLSSASSAEIWSLHGEATETLHRRILLLADRPDEAFAAAEQAHSFGLGGTGLADLELHDLERRMPPSATMLHLSRIGDDIYAWAIEQGRSTHFVIPIANEELLNLRAAVAGPDGAPGRWDSARRLYDLLLAPLEAWMSPDHTAVLVPDRVLAGVPFAALRSPDGRIWIERRGHLVAPSASAFLQASERSAARLPAVPGVLVLSDPLRSPSWQHLPALERALSEGETVAGFYQNAVHLHGATANKPTFLRQAQDADFIHVATHAVSNSARPDVSFLALSPADDAGALYYPEIHQLHLDRGPLVVLSACGTAAVAGPEGMTSSNLAQAFLAAGARAVIGTRQRISDTVAERFGIELHRRLSRGESVAHALRQVQLQLLREGVDEWSTFQLIGGIGPET